MKTLPNNYYDNDAQRYNNLLVKQRFDNPAKDLANLLPIIDTSHVLDIGTGTGAFLFHALKKIGPKGNIIGVDPSEDMLKVAHQKGAPMLLKGRLPNLPFLDQSFDIVGSSFVLSHLKDYEKGLLEIKRILKTGGVFGCTTWREGQSDYNKIWSSVLSSFINKRMISEMLESNLFWENWFENAENIRKALAETGFEKISIHEKVYRTPMQLEHYLDCRYTLLTGKLAKKTLSSTLWQKLKNKMYNEFHKECGDTITYISKVHINLAQRK